MQTYEGLPVASINMWAFENCNILSSINVAEGNGYFKSVDGVLYSADMTTLIKYPASKTDKSYTVPDSVTEIEYQAFAGCKYLEKLTLSANVSVIENRIFDNCQSLTELVIKEGTTTIGYAVLEGCTNLAKVSIPESVTAIEEYAFNKCTGLKTVEYAGSKSDWEEISIADYNSELTNADVICAKLDPAYEIAVFDGAWFDYEANEFNVNVYVDGVKESFAVLAAIYDEDNRLTAVEKVIVTTDDSGVVNIRIPTEPTYIIPKLKLFFRNDDNLSIPLDKPIVMENIMF